MTPQQPPLPSITTTTIVVIIAIEAILVLRAHAVISERERCRVQVLWAFVFLLVFCPVPTCAKPKTAPTSRSGSCRTKPPSRLADFYTGAGPAPPGSVKV